LRIAIDEIEWCPDYFDTLCVDLSLLWIDLKLVDVFQIARQIAFS